jgi:hypothetical protein
LLSPTFHLPLLKSRNKRSIRQIWLLPNWPGYLSPAVVRRCSKRPPISRCKTSWPIQRPHLLSRNAKGSFKLLAVRQLYCLLSPAVASETNESTPGRIHYGITRELRRAKSQRIGHLASTDQPQALSFYRRSRPTTYRNCKRPLMVISRRQVCSATSDYLLACMDECGVKRGFHESEHTDRLHPA